MAHARGLRIEGARQNNLKNVSLEIPHDRLTVVTGVSGSGKSSLAFDTLFAEGQWRYVESLSTYARMFLERVDRPDVDRIDHVRPAIALEQKNPVRTARSTVGTATEIWDHLRLLYARMGHVRCPACGVAGTAHEAASVVESLLASAAGALATVGFPVDVPAGAGAHGVWDDLRRRGFTRVRVDGTLFDLGAAAPPARELPVAATVVIDRLVLEPARRSRLAESVETALREGGGRVVADVDGRSPLAFSAGLACPRCGRALARPEPSLFSFNHPVGACPDCKGFGNILRYDETRVVRDPRRSLAEGAVEPWSHPSTRRWQRALLRALERHGVDATAAWADLPEAARQLVREGDGRFKGLAGFFTAIEAKRYKLHVRVFLSRYRSPFPCATCGGARLRPEARAVEVGGLAIHELAGLTVERAARFLADLPLSAWERTAAGDVLRRLDAKLGFLLRVGLGYLTLARQTRTLSGGEAQRIALANQLGAQLVGTLYVLDEPSIGLHARDTLRLVDQCRELAAAGNTVVVVEHDRSFIEAADHVVELGPGSGDRGGEIVYAGPLAGLREAPRSLTARYLSGRERVPLPWRRRPGRGHLVLRGARANNLKGVTLRVPLETLTVVTGVSGSGKSTLVHDTLYPAVAAALRTESFQAVSSATSRAGAHAGLEGVEHLRDIRLVDQEPIGRTPRSNPVTYVRAFDPIRHLFAALPRARALGLGPGAFSFNVAGGRCETCAGAGVEKLEMYFVEDVYVTCAACGGRRYRGPVLEVRHRGHDIAAVLGLTVDEAVDFFAAAPAVVARLKPLQDVGLGYLRLGHPATKLSGGEAQRLKIAAELGERGHGGVLYVLDEPTTGLHLDDVRRLVGVLDRLVDAGHTVVVVEHHLDVAKCADWIVDLGPEAGDEGGEVVAEGTPEAVAQTPGSWTGKFLAELLPRGGVPVVRG